MSLSKSDRRKVAFLASFFCASLAALPKIGATDSPSASTLTSAVASSAWTKNTSASMATKSTKDDVHYSVANWALAPAQEGTSENSPSAADEQKATNPPKITYADGQLTVIAENSLLSDILSQLHALMGADIDLPAGASSERIWVRLGPGPARKVLSQLLSDTDLNFVIQGSETDANGIRSVLLTPHTEPGPGTPGASTEPQQRMADRLAPRANPSAIDASQQETPLAAQAAQSSDAMTPSSSTPTSGASGSAIGSPAGFEESAAHPSPPAALTEESINQQLLSMYQQRRQLQANQPSTATPVNGHP